MIKKAILITSMFNITHTISDEVKLLTSFSTAFAIGLVSVRSSLNQASRVSSFLTSCFNTKCSDKNPCEPIYALQRNLDQRRACETGIMCAIPVATILYLRNN